MFYIDQIKFCLLVRESSASKISIKNSEFIKFEKKLSNNDDVSMLLDSKNNRR